jgi:hypothetical protein
VTLLLPLVACASPEDEAPLDSGGPASGTIAMRFAIDEDHAAEMGEEPKGMFYGAVFPEDVVEPTGADPEDALESFALELALDAGGAPTTALYTSGPLPPGKVYVLGYLDSDDNSPDEPDAGDPVTLPGFSDRVEVLAGEIVEQTVVLDLLMP